MCLWAIRLYCDLFDLSIQYPLNRKKHLACNNDKISDIDMGRHTSNWFPTVRSCIFGAASSEPSLKLCSWCQAKSSVFLNYSNLPLNPPFTIISTDLTCFALKKMLHCWNPPRNDDHFVCVLFINRTFVEFARYWFSAYKRYPTSRNVFVKMYSLILSHCYFSFVCTWRNFLRCLTLFSLWGWIQDGNPQIHWRCQGHDQ